SSKMQVSQFIFNNDSVGIVNIDAEYSGKTNKLAATFSSPNADYDFSGTLALNFSDSAREQINTTLPLRNMRINVLKKYLGIVFDDIDGYASGDIQVVGKMKSPRLLGKVILRKALLKIDYTKCVYTIDSAVLNFGNNYIDFGTLQLKDEKQRPGIL